MNKDRSKYRWKRPDLDESSELSRQQDLLKLFKQNGELLGVMEVDNYPDVAVARQKLFTETGYEKVQSIENVPPSIGIVCTEGPGKIDWMCHNNHFYFTDGSKSIMNLCQPDDGHSQYLHANTDISMRNVFVPHSFIRKMAEVNPDQLEAFGRMVEGFDNDATIDIRPLVESPLYQNALAAIFAQPFLGNSSAEYVKDNILTLFGVFADRKRPASFEKIRYDNALRSKVLDARQIIEDKIKAPLSLRELALAIGTNENYLKAAFKHEFGLTVFEYLLECRMRLARKLLLDTDWKIKAIALEVGYSDAVDLFRPFRLRFGLTPAQFRNTAANL